MVSPEWQDSDVDSTTSSDGLHEDFENASDYSNTIGDWVRCAWTLCAAASIVTSKFILVDFNFHYPLHLVIIQLVAAGAITLFGKAGSLENIVGTTIVSVNHPWLFSTMLNCLDALSLAFSTQAILHFPNLPTLAMLSILAAVVDLTRSSIFHGVIHPRNEAVRILALAISFSVILYGEYRLTVNGIMFSISAAICAGMSKSLGRIHHDAVSRSTITVRETSFYICSLILTTVWVLFEEKTWSMIADFRLAIAPTLALNIVSSAAVLVLGRSWILPSYPPKIGGILDPKNVYGCGDIASYLVLSGLTGYSSVLMLRRSYTSPIQFVAFFMAIVCLDNGRLFGLTRWYQSRPQGAISLVGNLRDVIMGNNSDRSKKFVHRLLNYSAIYPILSFIILGLWMAFIIENFTKRSTTAPGLPLALDLAYRPHVDMEIVISMYHEPLDSVNYLIASLKAIPSLSSAIVHIYTKDEHANLETIQQHTGADNVTQLTNVGREGETYLRHIVDNWDSLARHTLFIQGEVHNPRELFPRVRDYYDPERTGMLGLGFSGNVCDCKSCGDRWGWSDSVVYSIFADIYPRVLCSELLLSYKGQFIASARRIRGVQREVYEKLLDALVMEDSWAHREDYLKGRKDSLNAPFFGFTLERLWNVLLQCSDLDVAWRCPTLLSGRRSGGDKGDCQCFDYFRR